MPKALGPLAPTEQTCSILTALESGVGKSLIEARPFYFKQANDLRLEVAMAWTADKTPRFFRGDKWHILRDEVYSQASLWSPFDLETRAAGGISY